MLCFFMMIPNYLITESEVVTGKSQTEGYCIDLAITQSIRYPLVNTVGQSLRFPRND